MNVLNKNGTISPKLLEASPELIEIQAFMPMSQEDRERLKADIEKSGIVRDAIKVYTNQITGKKLILGGYNRCQIALELKLSEVPFIEYEGTPDEYRELVINDNLNRRHLNQAQKNNLIDYLLKKDPTESNRTIAKKTGTSPTTVQTRREKSGVQSGHVKGKDGKIYKHKPDEKKKNLAVKKPKKSKEETPGPHHYIVNAIYAGKLDFHQLNHVTVKVIEEALGKLGGQERIDYINNIKTLLKRLNV